MRIQVLDCTLRDGGYCNNWDFGLENIKYIIKKLILAKVDIVEVGFISDKKEQKEGNSIFRSIEKLQSVLPKEQIDTKFVCMCNYGEVDFKNLEREEETGIQGIRLAFHKKDWESALEAAKMIQDKGYELYLQPMVTMNYTDLELLKLIEGTNEIEPEAFYIVDSFGIVRKEDLLRMYYLVNHNLNRKIKIGYHAHNNLQLAYANAKEFMEISDERDKIIDSSVFGMGRGAGNLNTELFVEHLNRCFDTKYLISPLLQIIDTVLNKIYSTNYWGYSLPHYLSARHNCHPNYATYLSNKNTLNAESINEVLEKVPNEEKANFNKNLIEKIYFDYQSKEYDDTEDLSKLQQLRNQNIVLLAPGASLGDYKKEIEDQVQKIKATVISVNFLFENFMSDFVFISNQKRYERFEERYSNFADRLIVTSNIRCEEKMCCVNYRSLRNEIPTVEDNAMLMLLKLLIKLGIKKVYVAGMDGYTEMLVQNYYDSDMTMSVDKGYSNLMNQGIQKMLDELEEEIEICWITPSRFKKVN